MLIFSMPVAALSQFPKFGCMSRRNEWNKLIFWCVDTNSGKVKVTLTIFGGGGQKWEWSFRSWNSKICCITRTN